MVVLKTQMAFKRSIIPTMKENTTVEQLLDTLNSLHEHLSSLKQEALDVSSIDKYRAELMDRRIFKNKDAGVRTLCACCLSDILRLYAPHAPYTGEELRAIFQLFFSQFRLLKEPDNGYHAQQIFLATNLLEFRSIVLLTHVPKCDALIDELFEIFLPKEGAAFPERLYKLAAGLLGEIISECDALPTSALKRVFNRILSHSANASLAKAPPKKDAGFEISLIICETYSNRLGRHFIKLYSEIMYELLDTRGENGAELDNGGRHGKGYSKLSKLNRLTSLLWIYAPELVSSVLGFVNQMLCSDNELLRESATDCVGRMLATTQSQNFVVAHKETYKIWLSKMADISANVRVAWLSEISSILQVRSDISDDISKGLSKTLIDSDHVVRLAAVESLAALNVTVIWAIPSMSKVISALLHLVRETRRDVREKCLETVTELYVQSMQQENKVQSQDLQTVVKTIPSVILHLYYINDPNINAQVDMVLFEKLLPLTLSSELLVERLLNMVHDLDKKALSSFYAFNKRQLQMSAALQQYIQLCEKTNMPEGEKVSKTLEDRFQKIIQWLSFGFPDQYDVKGVLQLFRNLNNRRLYFLVSVIIADDSNYSKLRNAYQEFIRRLGDGQALSSHSDEAETDDMGEETLMVFKIILYRSAPFIYNVSNVPLLLRASINTDLANSLVAKKLIDQISEAKPDILEGQKKELIIIIENGRTTQDEKALPVGDALRTVYKIEKSQQERRAQYEDKFFDLLIDYTVNGSLIEAKYAVKLLSLFPSKEFCLEKVRVKILPLNSASKDFAKQVLVLSEIFKFAPHLLDENSTDIVSYLIKETLLANNVEERPVDNVGWISDENIMDGECDALAAKIFSLKLFTNKLRAIAGLVDEDELANVFTQKTIKLFVYIIAGGGELIPEDSEYFPTPPDFQTRLRCSAGLQVLKLAKIPALSHLIKSEYISKLVNLVEDESLKVRSEFLEKLKDFLGREEISIKFLPLIFFTAYEPNADLKATIKTWINFMFDNVKAKTTTTSTKFERALPRFIHSIAHHPDIVNGLEAEGKATLDSLTTAVDYLIFYFDSIANASNLSLLYYFSARVKQYQDALEDEIPSEGLYDSESNFPKSLNVYVIAELSQLVLNQLSEQKNWSIAAHPANLNLPGDIFKPFDTIDKARQNAFETYLTQEQTSIMRKTIEMKLGRLSKKSQTVKQQVQKRKLDDEYKGSKRKVITGVHQDSNVKSLRSATSFDDVYVPPTSSKESRNVLRKSSRQKKNVNYDDGESDDEY
ncbi:LAMI_0F10528g1_1 [Lachancea mirantina]|uniref:LAMI_0F10528g1_1 n=1 Tax=Lachancea mirantina TaxID=1230905 RepID=A0A1G4K1Y0_9SACH|nr:LAMI_0F10528g1_1 [Lachancea mirantina]